MTGIRTTIYPHRSAPVSRGDSEMGYVLMRVQLTGGAIEVRLRVDKWGKIKLTAAEATTGVEQTLWLGRAVADRQHAENGIRFAQEEQP